jgi:glutamate formiminotransferase/formiminotetrahydrofolate cyclodeaminase
VARVSEPAAEFVKLGGVRDAGVAALLADAAAQSAALNVKININSIEDAGFARSKWDCVQEILAETATLRDRVVKLTYEKLG